MNELSPKNRELFEHGALGLAPQEADKLRVERALAISLGLAASTSLAAPAAAGASAGKGAASTLSLLLTLGKWIAAVAIVGGLGAVGLSAYRATNAMPGLPHVTEAPSAIVDSSSIAPVGSGGADAPSATSDPTATPDIPPSASVSAAPPRAAPTTSQSAQPKVNVLEEAKLLRDADAALRSGDTAGALALLEEHRRTYPNGVLAAERNVERVLSLCKMGRGEGKREALRLIKANPKSPLAASMRASCGIDSSDP